MFNSFHFIHQHDSMQCGIACLAMISRHYGKKISMRVLSNLCFTTKNGVSLLGISEVARTIGFTTNCGRLSVADLSQMPLPCILHWNQKHFVVLYKTKGESTFYIADPGKGLVRYGIDVFKEHWISANSNGEDKGIAMFLNPTSNFYKSNLEEDSTDYRTVRFLFGYLKKYRHRFIHIILGLIVGSVLQLILPFLTQAIVDIGIKNQDIGFVWLILIGQLVLTTSRTAINFIRRWLLLHISIRVNISLISDFFIKLLKLPMSFFDSKLMGDLLQRMGDHNRVNTFLTQRSLNILFSVFTFIVFSIVLLIYSRLIFFVFSFASMIYGGWLALFLRRRKILDYEIFEQQAINNNKTYEFVTSMQEIKLQNCEQRRRCEWEETQTNLLDVQMRCLKLKLTQEAGGIFINEIKNIIITIVAATAVIQGQITLGMMLAIQYIIGQLNSPIENIMNFIYYLQDMKISLERINEIHLVEEENGEMARAEIKNKENGISLKNILFKYNPHATHKIIDNVNFNIPYGKVTAIVGASGSGKTTLIRLLLGYYPVSDGTVCIGETNINDIDKKWWRRQCGVVMQNGIIFSESIARNIAIDDGDIDEERLLKAAKIACIKEYIMSLPLKFNTKIGRDGMDISQGQRQRILIARAVYKDPDYIFLDEATNSMDANNERMIVSNLSQFYYGKTVVIVAHRLSTVRNADQIIVMDKGKVMEIGTHDKLTAQKGAYYKLVKNQLELGN